MSNPHAHVLLHDAQEAFVVLWICAVPYGALWLDTGVALPELVRATLPLLTLPLAGITMLLALVAFLPDRTVAFAERLGRGAMTGSLRARVTVGLAETTRSFAALGRVLDPNHLACHAASIAFLFTYVTVGYVLAHAFGFPIGYGRAITIFSVSLLVAYLSPVPGSVGVTELTSSYMLDPALTAESMATSLGVRLLCWYLVTVPGGVVLAVAVRHARRRSP